MDSRGEVYAETSGMKCAKYFTSPTKRNTSGYDLRVRHSHTLAILSVSAWRPWSSIRCPRQSMSNEYRSSLDWLIYSRCFLRIANTVCRCSSCSRIVSEKMNISSRYTHMKSLRWSWNIHVMRRWNVAGALQSPCCMTWDMNVPNGLVNVVFHTLSLSIRICLYVSDMSILVRYLD